MNALKAVGGFASEDELENFSDRAREQLEQLSEDYKNYRETIDQYETYGGVGKDEYDEAVSESAKVVMEARVIANNEYLESDGYQLM